MTRTNAPFTPLTLINLNGRIVPPGQAAEEAKVSVFDRSYIYGDSLYEVVRTYNGRFFHLDFHLNRLEASAGLCQMVLGQSLEHYRLEVERTFREWRALPGNAQGEAYCRIIVSRGEGRIGFGLSCLTSPTLYTIILQPVDQPSQAQYEKGYHFTISKRLRNHPRAIDPAMKSGNYLNSLLAYLEASAEEFDDALLCNGEGHVTEGTTFNIFYVKRGILVTPPLDIGILDGITRRLIIQLAREQGIPVREVRFPPDRLFDADEVFMSSSVKEVFPVTRIDLEKIGSGHPGPITLKLQQAYRELIQRSSQ